MKLNFTLVCCFVVFLWIANSFLCLLSDNYGTLGDQFGAVNALFSGLAFVGLIYTIRQQKESIELQREDLRNQLQELKNNREELELSRREMEEQTAEFEKQNKTLNIQRFENTFFQMMNLQQQIVSGLEFEVRSFQGSLNRGPSGGIQISKSLFKGREVFEHLFYGHFGYSGIKDTLVVDGLEGYVNNESRSLLDHYFRHFYTILKFIDKSEAIPTLEEKYVYSTILRATLSRYELVLIYYNGLCSLGNKKLKPLLEKYCMLKNLNEDLLTISFESIKQSGCSDQKELKGRLCMTNYSCTDYWFFLTENKGDENKYLLDAFYHTDEEKSKVKEPLRKFQEYFINEKN